MVKRTTKRKMSSPAQHRRTSFRFLSLWWVHSLTDMVEFSPVIGKVVVELKDVDSSSTSSVEEKRRWSNDRCWCW